MANPTLKQVKPKLNVAISPSIVITAYGNGDRYLIRYLIFTIGTFFCNNKT